MEDEIDGHLLIKYDPAVELKIVRERKAKQSKEQRLCEDVTWTSNELEEILNCTISPEEWEEDGKLFRQMLSHEGGTSRLDAVNLQHNLDSLLHKFQARETGICPVRRQLFSHCFDEIIRQVAIDSPERGLLLLRMRDDMRMTVAAYHTLYENAVAYGPVVEDNCLEIKQDLMDQITILDEEAEVSRRQVEKLRLEVEYTRRTFTEKRELASKRFAEDIQFLKRANNLLKESILTVA